MTSTPALDSGVTGGSRYYLIKANDWESFFGKLAFGLGIPPQNLDFNMNGKGKGSRENESAKEPCSDENGSSSKTYVPNKYMSSKQRKKREHTNGDNSTVNIARESLKTNTNMEIIHLGLDTNNSFQIEQVQYINNMNNISTNYIAEKSRVIDLNFYQSKNSIQNDVHSIPEPKTETTNIPNGRTETPVASEHRREIEEAVEQNCTVLLHNLQYFPVNISDVDEADKSVTINPEEVNAHRACNTKRQKSEMFSALNNQRKRPCKSMFAFKSILMTEKRPMGKIVKRKPGRPKKITYADSLYRTKNSIETFGKSFTTNTENEVEPESLLTNLNGGSSLNKRGRPRKNKTTEVRKKSESPVGGIKIDIESSTEENVTDTSEAVDKSISTHIKKRGRPRKYKVSFSDFQNKVHDGNEKRAKVNESLQTLNINRCIFQHRDEHKSNCKLNDSNECVEENHVFERKKRGRPRKQRNSANGSTLQIETKYKENFKLDIHDVSEIVPQSANKDVTSNNGEENKSCEKVTEIVLGNKKKRGRPRLGVKSCDTLSDIQSESNNGDDKGVNTGLQIFNVNPSKAKNCGDESVCKDELNISVESVENNCGTERKRGRPRKPRNIAIVDVMEIKTKCEEDSRVGLRHDGKASEGENNEFCRDISEDDVSEKKKRGRPKRHIDTVSSSHNEILNDEQTNVNASLVPVLSNQRSGSTQMSKAGSEDESSKSYKGTDADSLSEKRKRGKPGNAKASNQTLTHVELNVHIKSEEYQDNLEGIGTNDKNETEQEQNTYIPICSGNNELGIASVENRQRSGPRESKNTVEREEVDIGENANYEVCGDRNCVEIKPGTYESEDAAESISTTSESTNVFNSTTEYTETLASQCSSFDMELDSKADLQDIDTTFADTDRRLNVPISQVIKKEAGLSETFDNDDKDFCDEAARNNVIYLKRKLRDYEDREAKFPNTKQSKFTDEN